MVNKKFTYRLFGTLMIAFGVSIFLMSKNSDRLRDEYPRISIEDQFKGRIIKIKCSNGVCNISLKERKFRIGIIESKSFDRPLYKILKYGDLLIKNKNSDTVYIKKHNSTEFIIIEPINNEPNQ